VWVVCVWVIVEDLGGVCVWEVCVGVVCVWVIVEDLGVVCVWVVCVWVIKEAHRIGNFQLGVPRRQS